VDPLTSKPPTAELHSTERILSSTETIFYKDEFLAIVAHELRSPLLPMRTGLEALRRAADKSAALDRIRPMMERQVTQMVRIIEDLLDTSRVTSGTIHLDRRPTSLAELVHDAVEANRTAIEEAGLELSVHVPDRACLVDVDAARFVQVLSNLLADATKFTDPGGRIDVIASIEEDVSGPRASIAVRDTGIGIPAATLPHVFDLFVKGDSGDRSRKGLGIGLALSRRLMEMLGGRIDVSSEGAGRGSTFTIRMPVLPSAGDPSAVTVSRPRAGQT
jgi:signal transduction histidine kinase